MLGDLPLQDRALAFDAVLGEPALHDRALASSAFAAVLWDLPQQARALAAAAVLGELAEQDFALASVHAAGLGALHPERALHGADAASSGALGGQLGASPVLHPGEEEPRLLPLQAEVPAWNQNVPEFLGGDTVKSAELTQIEKGTLKEGIGEPEEEPSELLPERDLHGPVWLSYTGPLGSTNVAGKSAGWKKEAISKIDSAKGTVSSVQLGIQIQSEKHGDWKNFSPSVIQQPKGPHNFSFSSVFPSLDDDEKMKKCGDGWKITFLSGSENPERVLEFSILNHGSDLVDGQRPSAQFGSQDHCSAAVRSGDQKSRSASANPKGMFGFPIFQTAAKVAFVASMPAPAAGQGEDRDGLPGILWTFLVLWTMAVGALGAAAAFILQWARRRRNETKDEDYGDYHQLGGVWAPPDGAASSSSRGPSPSIAGSAGEPPSEDGRTFNAWAHMWATGAIDENEEWYGDWDTPQAARRRRDQEDDEIAKGKAKEKGKLRLDRPFRVLEPDDRGGLNTPSTMAPTPRHHSEIGEEEDEEVDPDFNGEAVPYPYEFPIPGLPPAPPQQQDGPPKMPPRMPAAAKKAGAPKAEGGKGVPKTTGAAPKSAGPSAGAEPGLPSVPVGAALAAGLQSVPVADGFSDEGTAVPLHVAAPPGAILMSGYWPPPKAAAAGSQSVPEAAPSSAAQSVPVNAAGPSGSSSDAGQSDGPPGVINDVFTFSAALQESGKVIYTTPCGQLYHTNRRCGKLKAARKVFTVKGCADCTRGFRGGVMVRLACGWFHVELHGPLTQNGTTASRPCTERGGYGP